MVITTQFILTVESWRSYHGPAGAMYAQGFKGDQVNPCDCTSNRPNHPRATQVLAGS
jgi:hypothetical protein